VRINPADVRARRRCEVRRLALAYLAALDAGEIDKTVAAGFSEAEKSFK
jgi:hypothetical protein